MHLFRRLGRMDDMRFFAEFFCEFEITPANAVLVRVLALIEAIFGLIALPAAAFRKRNGAVDENVGVELVFPQRIVAAHPK